MDRVIPFVHQSVFAFCTQNTIPLFFMWIILLLKLYSELIGLREGFKHKLINNAIYIYIYTGYKKKNGAV